MPISTDNGLNPRYLFLDTSWMALYEADHPDFFLRLPLTDVVERLLHPNAHVNLNHNLMFRADEILWEELARSFSENELNQLGFDYVNNLAAMVLDQLRTQIHECTRYVDVIDDDYVFHRWLSPWSLIVERVDSRQADHPRAVPHQQHSTHV